MARKPKVGDTIRILDPGVASLDYCDNWTVSPVRKWRKGDTAKILGWIDPKQTVRLIYSSKERGTLGAYGGIGEGWEVIPSPERETIKIRPGLMVGLSVTIEGGVSYRVNTIEPESVSPAGEARTKWETTRITADAAEHDAAVKLRATIRNSISGACCRIGRFGLLCPDNGTETLIKRIEEGEALAARWNATARTCRVQVSALLGRVEDTDARAVRAIRREVSEMLREVEAGISAADPERIRKAAQEARNAGSMLAPETRTKVAAAVEAARKVAREMTARIKDAGTGAADTLRTVKLDALRDARSAFLDLDSPEGMAEIGAVPRALDLDAPIEASAPVAAPRVIVPEPSPEAAKDRAEAVTTPTRSMDLDI